MNDMEIKLLKLVKVIEKSKGLLESIDAIRSAIFRVKYFNGESIRGDVAKLFPHFGRGAFDSIFPDGDAWQAKTMKVILELALAIECQEETGSAIAKLTALKDEAEGWEMLARLEYFETLGSKEEAGARMYDENVYSVHSDTPSSDGIREKEDIAIGLLIAAQRNGASAKVSEIAAATGINRTQLYKLPRFSAAWKAYKELTASGIPNGSMQDGVIEAEFDKNDD